MELFAQPGKNSIFRRFSPKFSAHICDTGISGSINSYGTEKNFMDCRCIRCIFTGSCRSGTLAFFTKNRHCPGLRKPRRRLDLSVPGNIPGPVSGLSITAPVPGRFTEKSRRLCPAPCANRNFPFKSCTAGLCSNRHRIRRPYRPYRFRKQLFRIPD